MKAVILVGGEGTRLRPLTETTPKPLLPFMNRPFLAHVLDHVAAHGVQEAICSSPYLESVFHSFLESRDDRPPLVRWITEERPLGTAGAVAGAREHLDDTFFVMNGDILTDLDLGALRGFHLERGAVATITLTEVDDARPYGLVEREDDGRVAAFREKPAEPVRGTVNAGTYVLEPAALELIPPGTMVSIERETYPLLIERTGSVFGFVDAGYWRDLGTPQAYLRGHVDALEGRVDVFRDVSRPLLGDDVRVAGSAGVDDDVVAGPGVVVEEGATVGRSVLHADVRVGRGAVVEGSVLGRGSVVGTEAAARGCVFGEGARVGAGVIAREVKLRPGERLEEGSTGRVVDPMM